MKEMSSLNGKKDKGVISMDEQRKEAWRKTLILWEAISNKPTAKLNSYTCLKTQYIRQLGFKEQNLSCPLCEVYYDRRKCTNCPIRKKFTHKDSEVPCRHIKCPYREYSDILTAYNIHDQNLAELFYRWLINLAKEEGYEPDFNLKYW